MPGILQEKKFEQSCLLRKEYIRISLDDHQLQTKERSGDKCLSPQPQEEIAPQKLTAVSRALGKLISDVHVMPPIIPK